MRKERKREREYKRGVREKSEKAIEVLSNCLVVFFLISGKIQNQED